MNEIQKMALDKGLRFMGASGARYLVIDAAGFQHSNDPKMVLEKEPEAKTYKRKYPHRFLADIYQEGIDKLEPGKWWIYEAESEQLAHDVRASASSHCGKTFGNKACMSTVVDKSVQILRVM